MSNRFTFIRIITALLILSLTVATPALATAGNLPGGTSLSVSIDSPLNGEVLPSSGDVTIQGGAAIGEGQPLPLTMMAYVVDVSGSTSNPGCGGDQNGDGDLDTVLDCEIASIKALNTQAITSGTVNEVGLVAFSTTAAQADLGPAASPEPEQFLTTPSADADANGTLDVDEVANSLNYGTVDQFTRHSVGRGNTSFSDGLTAAVSTVSLSTQPGRMIVFTSD